MKFLLDKFNDQLLIISHMNKILNL